jgi:hypothetical protein
LGTCKVEYFLGGTKSRKYRFGLRWLIHTGI